MVRQSADLSANGDVVRIIGEPLHAFFGFEAQGLIAESADIYGQLDGNILCSGTIRIFKSGSVLGDATARSIVLKDGGILTGQMTIQPDVETPLPPKRSRHFDGDSASD